MKRKIKLNFMKKNQVVVAVVGLMLIAAGYMNYSNNEQSNSYIEVGSLADDMEVAEIGDAKLASANVGKENKLQDNAVNEVESNTLNENEEKRKRYRKYS